MEIELLERIIVILEEISVILAIVMGCGITTTAYVILIWIARRK